VLGINASTAVFGDYSGFPVNEPVSPLKGITDRFGNKIRVYGMPWTGNLSQHEIIPSGYLFHKDDQGVMKPGLKAEYFSDFKFTEKFTETTDHQINIDLINLPPNPVIPLTRYVSARWTGIIKPAVSGDYELGIIKNGGVRLIINGEKIIEGFNLERTVQHKKFAMEAGKAYDIVVEYHNYDGHIHTRDAVPLTCVSLLWKTPGQKASALFAKEKQLARKADVAIVVMGMNRGIESEGLDRKTLQLPEDQQLFIREIFKVNPKTILVLVAGSQLSVRWEQDNLPAIVNAWYPGEQGGTAIAEVLFGEHNPAARLPLTYYESLDELPAFNDYQVTNGRTYMYFKGKQLYPFGFGLSYTTFEYSDICAEKPEVSVGDTIRVSVNVKNTGKYDGDEIVQLYLKSPGSRAENPVHQLKGFKRIHLKKGENETVRFELDRESLSYWNHDNNCVVEPGEYELQIGASSADIRQRIKVKVTQGR
jgi:beta-glucosidase